MSRSIAFGRHVGIKVPSRIAVAGATGHIGTLVSSILERRGVDVVPISRSHGLDLTTGVGLAKVLAGADAVVDVMNSTAADVTEAVNYLGTATRNLIAAERAAGVRHHVLLSIVGSHRVQGNAHYAGKREQEALVEVGSVPWTIVPATQFHDFGAIVASWAERDGIAAIAPLLVQPIAPLDIADVLAEVALGEPQGRYPDVAGRRTEDLVDMARRTLVARGHGMRLVPTWTGLFGIEMAGEVLLPGPRARIASQTFDEWLTAGATP